MKLFYVYIIFIHVLFSPAISKEEVDPFEKKTTTIVKEGHIHNLPLSILTEIFVYVIDEPKDIATINATCKKWHQFMSNPQKIYFGQAFLNKQYQKVIQHFNLSGENTTRYLSILYVLDIHNKKLRAALGHDNVLNNSNFKAREVIKLCKCIKEIWSKKVNPEVMEKIEESFKLELAECFKLSCTNKNFQEAFTLLIKLQEIRFTISSHGRERLGILKRPNIFEGRGILLEPNGTFLIGSFKKRRLNEKGVLYSPALIECGEFQNGRLHGYGKRFHPDHWTYDFHGYFNKGYPQFFKSVAWLSAHVLGPSLTMHMLCMNKFISIAPSTEITLCVIYFMYVFCNIFFV